MTNPFSEVRKKLKPGVDFQHCSKHNELYLSNLAESIDRDEAEFVSSVEEYIESTFRDEKRIVDVEEIINTIGCDDSLYGFINSILVNFNRRVNYGNKKE